MVLVREIVEPLSIIREYRCPVCGIHYRVEERDLGCAVCLNGKPKPEARHDYMKVRGTRKAQAEKIERIWAKYQALYPEYGNKTTGIIARSENLKLETVQSIIRRRREKNDTV